MAVKSASAPSAKWLGTAWRRARAMLSTRPGEAASHSRSHRLHLLPHEVGLRAAQVAGDDRMVLLPRPALDVAFARVVERADDHVASVVGDQLRRHRLQAPAVEHVEEERLHGVVGVVSQRDLGGADARGDVVEHAPAQARADRAVGLASGGERLHHRVCVLFDDVELDAEAAQVVRQDVRRKAGLLLVQIHRHHVEVHGRVAAQREQDVQHRGRNPCRPRGTPMMRSPSSIMA